MPMTVAQRVLIQSSFSRVRFQLGIGLFLSIILPVLVLPKLSFQADITRSTLSICLMATVTAYFIMRQLIRFPGIIGISYVLPSFTISYLGFFLIILLLRIDYSRSYLLTSGFLSTSWFLIAVFFEERWTQSVFAVVPFGNSSAIGPMGNTLWVPLAKPSLPANMNVSGVVADLRTDMPDEWETFIAETAIHGTPVYHYKHLAETLSGRVEIEHLSENTLGSLIPNMIYVRAKRWGDVAVALLLLPFFLILFGILAILIRLDSPGPVFFRQPRIGYRGEEFIIWKFRTMTHNHGGTAETRHNDPRITRIGRFLRKMRIDEMPQIFNIIMGDMSWIGPRPEAVDLSRNYEQKLPYYRYRHIVLPGLTGWAQVNQGHVFEVDEVLSKLHYDFFYVKHFSMWLDLLICLRTARIMLTGFGAR